MQYPPDQQPWNQSTSPQQAFPSPYPPSAQQGSGPPWGQSPRQKRSFRQWFKSRKRGTKLGLGCASIAVILSMCLCAIVASANGNVPQQAALPTATPTTAALVAQDTPTDTPVPTDTSTATPRPTATPTPKPTPKPQPTATPRPTPTPKPHCSGVNGNPWCYDFNPGKLIYVPPSGFCGYFNCIPTFYGSDDPGDGYIIECSDSTYSQSGGESGACSYHGGEMRPLYAH